MIWWKLVFLLCNFEGHLLIEWDVARDFRISFYTSLSRKMSSNSVELLFVSIHLRPPCHEPPQITRMANQVNEKRGGERMGDKVNG